MQNCRYFVSFRTSHEGSATRWNICGTGDSQCDSRESIRANHSQMKPQFFIARQADSPERFARITRISDSHESPDSRESCESIRAKHATKRWNICCKFEDQAQTILCKYPLSNAPLFKFLMFIFPRRQDSWIKSTFGSLRIPFFSKSLHF